MLWLHFSCIHFESFHLKLIFTLISFFWNINNYIREIKEKMLLEYSTWEHFDWIFFWKKLNFMGKNLYFSVFFFAIFKETNRKNLLTLYIAIIPDISELRWIVIIVGVKEWSRNCLWSNMWLQSQSCFQFLAAWLTPRTRAVYIRHTAIGWTWW